MTKTEAVVAFTEVREIAEQIKNNKPAKVGTVSQGDVIRQGDLYLVAIDSIPKNAKPTRERQLAPGTSQGSRHILVGDCEVFTMDVEQVSKLIKKALPNCDVPTALIGPVFRTIGEVTVGHPEHGHRTLPAGECFAVVYQRDFAEEVRRVAD